jgi:hypothetical protein
MSVPDITALSSRGGIRESRYREATTQENLNDVWNTALSFKCRN